MWSFWNIVVDLLQEAPSFWAALLKYVTDSGVNKVDKINQWNNFIQYHWRIAYGI